MTRNEILRRWPNASEALIRRNLTEEVVELAMPDSPRDSIKTTQVCLVCQAVFKAQPSEERKYCSKECAYNSKDRVAHVQRKDRGTRECVGCGVRFALTTKSPNAIFCSRKCSSSTIGKVTMAKNRVAQPRTQEETLTCPVCSVQFKAWKTAKRVYCSVACMGIGVAPKTQATNHARGNYSAQNSYSRAKRGWRTIGGKRVFFRSRMEANWARYLEFQGKVWEFEPKTFWFPGIKRGVTSYTPDFFVDGRYVETKGWMDAKSKTKLKRMAKYHPDVIVEVVQYKRYRAIAKQVSALIPDWEHDKK